MMGREAKVCLVQDRADALKGAGKPASMGVHSGKSHYRNGTE